MRLQMCFPSGFTVALDCISSSNEEKFNFRQYFFISNQRVRLTTDTWIAITNLSCMSFTSHYIDNEWKLQGKLFIYCPISSHVADVIGATIGQYLFGWHINKVLTVTFDNATSKDVAFTIYFCSLLYDFV